MEQHEYKIFRLYIKNYTSIKDKKYFKEFDDLCCELVFKHLDTKQMTWDFGDTDFLWRFSYLPTKRSKVILQMIVQCYNLIAETEKKVTIMHQSF